MTYPQALNYLNSFINYECLNLYPRKSFFNLERVEKLLQFLGSPQRSLRVIHVAGTKGKGSTCIFLANILKEAGFKAGLYTSPHLVDVRERIRILRPSASSFQPSAKDRISKKDFARLIETIRPHAERLRKTNSGELSYFEVLTCLAFMYFKEEKIDFVVLETGIGGRLDATNVASSLVCAITPISYEHTQVLGRTLKEIAAEKAGIIKFTVHNVHQFTVQGKEARRQIVITAPQKAAALDVIRRRAKKCKARLYEAGKDIQIEEGYANYNGGQLFNVKGIFAEYSRLKAGLLGRHQINNAAVAIGCAEALRDFGVKISSGIIRRGLSKTFWPGRLQVISRRPLVILDGAQNRASALALKEAVHKSFKFNNLVLVLGVSQDKDVRGILKELSPSAAKIILTRTQNPRALRPEIIKSFIKTNSKPVILTGSSLEALKIARQNVNRKDLILICGSLFLVGEVLKEENERIIFK